MWKSSWTRPSASAHRAAALTHRLLAFARRQPLDPGPVDVNQLIMGMEDLLRRSVGEQIDLEFGLAEDVWPAVTDANQLENALLNLVINSRDAMPRRRPAAHRNRGRRVEPGGRRCRTKPSRANTRSFASPIPAPACRRKH